jgi:uncharacterized protein
MLGIIVQLAISWLLLWLFEKRNLGVLGFFPTKKRWSDFTLFFIITAACCASGFLFRFIFGNERWMVNPKLSGSLIADGVWWNIKSVLFEELIFRGVIFYILIKKLGASKAIIISAVAFGIYHWFSFGILGNVKQMVIVFFMTGLMGLLLAYGYAKTFSLYIPCAIHLGWNFTQGFIFSSGPTGNGILIQIKNQADVNVGYVIFFCILFLPVISMLLINYFLLKRRKQAVLFK